MAIPKKHKERVEKFVRIVLEKVTKEEAERLFFKKGKLTDDYIISIYSTGLLPNYNDDTIEVSGDINGKTIGVFLLSGKSIADHTLDDNLVKEIVNAYMTIRIKEIKS